MPACGVCVSVCLSVCQSRSYILSVKMSNPIFHFFYSEAWQVATLIADSKRRSLLMVGGNDKMFMTRSLNVTPKTTEQHLHAIVHIIYLNILQFT